VLTALGTALLAAALLGCVAPISAPSPVQVPVVIWFDDFNEVFVGTGTRTSFLQSRPLDIRGRVHGARCVGRADLRIVPPEAVPGQRCDGIRGDALLTCSDERTIAIEWWSQETCLSGYGRGFDSEGHELHLVFGGTPARAEMIVQEALADLATKPVLPPVGAGKKAFSKGISTGTGFFVTWDGYLVTNHHVISEASRIQVKLDDADLLDAELVTNDEENDLALLRVDAIRRPLRLRAKHGLRRGHEIFTLGYPLIQLQGQEQKATFGRVNALSGLQGDERFAQIDAPIQPGNSGGPLLNVKGEVAGIVSSMLHPLATLRVAGVLPQNVNYAIKSDLAYQLLRIGLGRAWDEGQPDAAGGELSELIAELESSVVLVVAH
jgi:S1-C subfamily serine protease